MLTFTLVNSCFWVGIGLMMGRFFREIVSRLLATAVVGFATIVISLELLSLGQAIQLGPVTWICGLTFVLGLVIANWPRTGNPRQQPGTIGEHLPAGADRNEILKYAGILIVGFAIWTALDCLIYGLFTPVQVDSDAPTYHLPFAIHWARVGRLDFVPTPFGEEGAPYFPANGDLWMTWLTVTSQGGAVVKVAQWPFLMIGGLTLYEIAQQAGASRESGAIAAGIWSCQPLALRQSSTANVDLIWTAFYLIAVSFVMRYRDRVRRSVPASRELWMAGLSLGIVVGTKSVGLAYVPLLAVPLIWMIWVRNPSAGEGASAIRFRRLGQLTAGLLLTSVYWFVRNFRMTENPLYPLDVSLFDHRVLIGWYDTSAMRATAYHVPVDDGSFLVTRLAYLAGPCLVGLWIAGIVYWALAAIRPGGKDGDVETRLLSLLALLQVAIYWFIVPYNTQERFLLPALGIGLVPLSRALVVWPWSVWPLGLIFLGHVFLALLAGPTTIDDASFRTLRTLLQLESGWRIAALVGALVVAGALVFENRWFGWIVASAAVATGCALYGAPLARFAAQYQEHSFYPESGFGARMLTAWRIVESSSRQSGSRIAYAGGNLPYYLSGPSHRNDPMYVNVNRHTEWLPHDYHRARLLAGHTEKAGIPWPQWYREEADYEAWLENLRAARIELLFVSRTNLHGRRVALEGALPAFPIERAWADAHPEEFEDLGPHSMPQGSIPWARVYRLRGRSAEMGATTE